MKTRIRKVREIDVPDALVIQVFGWRWPAHYGENPAKKAFERIKATDAAKPDSGIGVWRSREQNPRTGEMLDWFVWVVDVNYELLKRLPELRSLDSRLVQPDEENAQRLVLRHLGTMREGEGDHVSMAAHYGLGAVLDPDGGMHIRAGRG